MTHWITDANKKRIKVAGNYSLKERQSFLLAHPIGSYYMSENSTSPAELYGGAWEKVEGRFLLGASASYPAKQEEGQSEVILTTSNMPQHRHGADYGYAFNTGYVDSAGMWRLLQPGSVTAGYGNNGFSLSGSRITNATGQTFIQLNYEGNNEAHNNMPPYRAVHIWYRYN